MLAPESVQVGASISACWRQNQCKLAPDSVQVGVRISACWRQKQCRLAPELGLAHTAGTVPREQPVDIPVIITTDLV